MKDIREVPTHYGVFWVNNAFPEIWGDYMTDEGYPYYGEPRFAACGMNRVYRFANYNAAEAFIVDQYQMFGDEFNRKEISLQIGEIHTNIQLVKVDDNSKQRVIYNKAVSKLTSEELTAIKSMIKNEE